MDIEETKERDCKSLSLMKQLIRSDAAKLLSQLVGSEYAADIMSNKTGADETIGNAVVDEVAKHAINTDGVYSDKDIRNALGKVIAERLAMQEL
jgi:hypothetical protein